MSTNSTVNLIAKSPMPFMKKRSFKVFQSLALINEGTREEHFERLIRAVSLFAFVINRDEQDQTIRRNTVNKAQVLLGEIVTSRKQKSRSTSKLENTYQKNVRDYGTDTEREFKRFEDSFMAMWESETTNWDNIKAAVLATVEAPRAGSLHSSPEEVLTADVRRYGIEIARVEESESSSWTSSEEPLTVTDLESELGPDRSSGDEPRVPAIETRESNEGSSVNNHSQNESFGSGPYSEFTHKLMVIINNDKEREIEELRSERIERERNQYAPGFNPLRNPSGSGVEPADNEPVE